MQMQPDPFEEFAIATEPVFDHLKRVEGSGSRVGWILSLFRQNEGPV